MGGAMGARRWWAAVVAVAAMVLVGAGPARADVPPPKVDVMFLVDTTGSMSGAIGEVRSELGDVMQRIGDGVPDAAFGLAQLRDMDESSGFSYRLEQGITTDRASVQSAANGLVAGGGGDGPEAYGPALARADS